MIVYHMIRCNLLIILSLPFWLIALACVPFLILGSVVHRIALKLMDNIPINPFEQYRNLKKANENDFNKWTGKRKMTNELGLELDKQAQYDVTKEEALALLVCLKELKLHQDTTIGVYEAKEKAVMLLKQYIEERDHDDSTKG